MTSTPPWTLLPFDNPGLVYGVGALVTSMRHSVVCSALTRGGPGQVVEVD